MKRLPLALCSVGATVMLTHPNPYYILDERNPLECEGKVMEVYGEYVRVIWNNGRENSYKGMELSSVPSQGYNSIWDTLYAQV